MPLCFPNMQKQMNRLSNRYALAMPLEVEKQHLLFRRAPAAFLCSPKELFDFRD